MSHAHFMTKREAELSRVVNTREGPIDIRATADRADDALQRLARLKHNASIAEWVETAAPIAALILAARTL